MNNILYPRLLVSLIQAKDQADITVTGISMNPTLYEGDRVTIKPCTTYTPGDILVYGYKNEGLLIHRLIRIDDRYYCKGDNAFRMEDIAYDNIIGKVTSVNGQTLEPWPDWKIRLSHQVNRQFHRLHFRIPDTVQTDTYRLYAALILRKGDTHMLYQKNTQMDFIAADETSLAVFDPDTGNTYFFDETGIDILNALEEASSLEALLDKLCQIYDTTPGEIREDVEEFLSDTVEKKVVILP
ncbi:MAG: PqqD family peptide modification chaperone [Lachnospiraceae bacterium]|nr:PqqD family peptide modification chaperone [Lachnospiraceae bacterium]